MMGWNGNTGPVHQRVSNWLSKQQTIKLVMFSNVTRACVVLALCTKQLATFSARFANQQSSHITTRMRAWPERVHIGP